MRDRVFCQVHPLQVLLGGFNALADGLRHFLGLAAAIADNALVGIADDDKRREGHILAALDYLGHAIDGDNLIFQVEPVCIDLFAQCHVIPLGLSPSLNHLVKTQARLHARHLPAP